MQFQPSKSKHQSIEITLSKKIYPWVVSSLSIFTLLSYFAGSHYSLLISSIISIAAFSLTHWLVCQKYFRSATYFLICFSFFISIFLSIANQRSSIKPILTIYVIFVPYIYVMVNKRAAQFFAFLLPVFYVLIYVLEVNGIIYVENIPTIDSLLGLLFTTTILATGFLFVFSLGIGTLEGEKAALEGEYKRLYDNIPIGIFRTTPEGVQVRANPALWKLEGYKSEQESIEDSFDIANEWYVDPNRRNDFVKEIETNGKVVNFESEIYHRKTGKKLWISETAYPMYDEHGNIVFFEGTVQDITQRKEAERKIIERAKELAQLSEEYRKVTNTARDVIIKANSDGVITFANPAVEQVFGYSPDEIITKNVESLIRGPENYNGWQRIAKLLRQRNLREPNHVLKLTGKKKNNEEIMVEITIADWINPAGEQVYTAIIRDVTEREKINKFLNHMQRLDSLGVLAGGIAHDFNNFLVAILGQTSLAMHKLEEGSAAHPHLVKAKDAIHQAADLAKKLLAYSGKGHFEIQAISLNDLIIENVNLHSIAIPNKIELITQLDDALPNVLGDKSQIQQVVMNLLINAADAIGQNQGSIKLSTEFKEIRKRDSLLWTRSGTPLKPGSYAVLHITDSGTGMDKVTLNRIFEPFYTTKGSGTGLGLAAVQGVVRGHQGSILVHSTPGKGTTFSVYFPIESTQKSILKPSAIN